MIKKILCSARHGKTCFDILPYHVGQVDWGTWQTTCPGHIPQIARGQQKNGWTETEGWLIYMSVSASHCVNYSNSGDTMLS